MEDKEKSCTSNYEMVCCRLLGGILSVNKKDKSIDEAWPVSITTELEI